jgi:hypothetical protein
MGCPFFRRLTGDGRVDASADTLPNTFAPARTGFGYAPEPAGWQAKVFPLLQPGRSSYSRFHISLCDAHGVARFVYQAVSSAEAVRVAESRLRALG